MNSCWCSIPNPESLGFIFPFLPHICNVFLMVRNQAPIILNNNVKISLHVHSFHHCCCLITEDSFLSAWALTPSTWFPLPLGMPFSLYLCSDIWCWTTYSCLLTFLVSTTLLACPYLYLVRHPTLGYCGPSISSAYGHLHNSFRTELFKNKWKGEGAKKDFWLYFVLTKISYSLWPKWKCTTQIKI